MQKDNHYFSRECNANYSKLLCILFFFNKTKGAQLGDIFSSVYLLKKMQGFRDCYSLVIQVLRLLVKFLLWIWNSVRNQMRHREPVEQGDQLQEGKFYSSLNA